MKTEPRAGTRVRSNWMFGGKDLLVYAVSGHGESAYVTVEVPMEDWDGHVYDTMTTTFRAADLEPVEGPGTWSHPW